MSSFDSKPTNCTQNPIQNVRIIIQWCFISTNVTICNTNSSWFYLEKWYFMSFHDNANDIIIVTMYVTNWYHNIIPYCSYVLWIRGFGHALSFRWNVHGLRSGLRFQLDIWLNCEIIAGCITKKCMWKMFLKIKIYWNNVDRTLIVI